MPTIRQFTTAATLAATAALAVGTTSAQAAVPCFKTFDGPGTGWKVQNDGAMMQSLHDSGSALDQNHGRLAVAGVQYPKLVGNHCAQSTISMSFPSRQLGGYSVARSVSATGGRLRWLDTITNLGAGKMVTVDFGLEVLGSQVLQTSESGNNSANKDDHWSIHKSGGLYSFHRWGQAGAIAQPAVLSEDGGQVWEHDFGQMDDDATLRYSFFIGSGQSVRLLHAAGTAKSLDGAKSAVGNIPSLFEGFSRAFADDIVNYTDDPDGDGVSKFLDDCPSLKALTPNGCPGVVQPDPPADPVDPGTQPTDGQPAEPNGAADTTAPGVSIRAVGSKLRRSALTGKKGAKAQVTCTEACSFTVKIVVKRRGSKSEKTVKTLSQPVVADGTRVIKLKTKSSALKRLAKQRVTLVVTATDRAGNSTTERRTVGLR